MSNSSTTSTATSGSKKGFGPVFIGSTAWAFVTNASVFSGLGANALASVVIGVVTSLGSTVGALVGGLTGGAVGSVLGGVVGRSSEGAVVGGAAGGFLGLITGSILGIGVTYNAIDDFVTEQYGQNNSSEIASTFHESMATGYGAAVVPAVERDLVESGLVDADLISQAREEVAAIDYKSEATSTQQPVQAMKLTA